MSDKIFDVLMTISVAILGLLTVVGIAGAVILLPALVVWFAWNHFVVLLFAGAPKLSFWAVLFLLWALNIVLSVFRGK